MRRSRRQRLRSRLSILVIVAMLWSQFAMASHPAASMAGMEVAAAAASTAIAHRGCHEQEPADQDAVCASHCTQGDQSHEIGRIPPVPALGHALPILLPLPTTLRAGSLSLSEGPPRVAWHRPTLHPANLLLI